MVAASASLEDAGYWFQRRSRSIAGIGSSVCLVIHSPGSEIAGNSPTSFLAAAFTGHEHTQTHLATSGLLAWCSSSPQFCCGCSIAVGLQCDIRSVKWSRLLWRPTGDRSPRGSDCPGRQAWGVDVREIAEMVAAPIAAMVRVRSISLYLPLCLADVFEGKKGSGFGSGLWRRWKRGKGS